MNFHKYSGDLGFMRLTVKSYASFEKTSRMGQPKVYFLQFYLIGEEEYKRENKLLLKCFLPTKKGAFDNECKILETLSRGKNKSGLLFLELRAKGNIFYFSVI